MNILYLDTKPNHMACGTVKKNEIIQDQQRKVNFLKLK